MPCQDLLSTFKKRIKESIWKAKDLFDKKDVDMLLVLKENKIIGIVTKKILNIELGKHVDLLTGLNKSDYIYYKAVDLLDAGNEISIIFIDVDNFGCVNKEFATLLGNKILEEIAELLKTNTLEGVSLCRFGGDEFVLVTPYFAEECKSST